MKNKNRLILVIILLLTMLIGLTFCTDQSQATVEIKSFSFQPTSITVPNETAVNWINRDAVTHTQ
jgi:plastocyanin